MMRLRFALIAGLMGLGLFSPRNVASASNDMEMMLLTDGTGAGTSSATGTCPGTGTCPCPSPSPAGPGSPKPVITPPKGPVSMGPPPNNNLPVSGTTTNMPGPGTPGAPTCVVVTVIATNTNTGATVTKTGTFKLNPNGSWSGCVQGLTGCYFGCVLVVAKPVNNCGNFGKQQQAGCPSCRVGVKITQKQNQ